MVKVNWRLLPIKAHYFFFLGAMGPILPFLPVMGRQLGVSEVVMGAINACLPFLFLLVKPLFGFLVDYFRHLRKAIFIGLLMLTTVSYALLIFVPYIRMEETSPTTCSTLKDICDSNATRGSCRVECSGRVVDVCYDGNISCEGCHFTCPTHFYSGMAFWCFVLLMSVGTVGYNVSNSISDAICFDVLGEGEELGYGKQRVWGTIGFGLCALLSGLAMNTISDGQDYTPAYIIALFCLLLDILCTSKLTLPVMVRSENILKDMVKLVRQPYIATFLGFATLVGICDSAMIFYLLWYLEDLAEQTGQTTNIKLLEGLTVAAETLIGELVFFSISGRVISRLGLGNCLTVCFALYSLRLGAVAWLPSPWWVVPIEAVLQGPTYALAYSTVVAYANAVSPPGASATVQGLVAGMDDGVGYAVGSLLCGVLYRAFGGKKMFLAISGLAAISSATHCILYLSFFRHSLQKKTKESSSVAAIHELELLKNPEDKMGKDDNKVMKQT